MTYLFVHLTLVSMLISFPTFQLNVLYAPKKLKHKSLLRDKVGASSPPPPMLRAFQHNLM